jgi:hypothetical protein
VQPQSEDFKCFAVCYPYQKPAYNLASLLAL